jgi:hypothetical protein
MLKILVAGWLVDIKKPRLGSAAAWCLLFTSFGGGSVSEALSLFTS